jgi:type I restriction enzyme S subunit
MMKRYDSYKDSGVEWIGKIPSHWEVASISLFTSSRSGGTPDRNKKEYWENGTIPWMSSGEVNKEFVYDTEEYITPLGSSCSSSKVIQKDSVMVALNGQGKTKGMAAVLKIDAACNQSLCAFSCDKRLYYMFLFYNFKAMYKYLRSQTGDETREGLAASFVKKQKISIPPISEQQSIANYLERTCNTIGKAIATQEKRVELLKELRQNIITQAVTRGINHDAPLKDSGVEWIGEVPEHWEIKRIKHCAQIFGRIGFRGYTTQDLVLEGEGPITLSPSNMQGRMNYDSCTYLSWFKYNESPEIQIHNGDVLFVKTGSTYGKSAYVENLPMEATINPQIVVFKDFKDCNSKFFYYLLTTDIVQSQVDNTVIGSTIPTIGQEKIRNYVIPIPPLSEQQEIVSYIESQTARLDKSIEKAEHQIELLQELKQSIITEVVTGKRKVV